MSATVTILQAVLIKMSAVVTILQAVLIKMSLVTERIDVFIVFLLVLQQLGILSFGDVVRSRCG
jgi:hypothetical protein